ncbi:phosphoribosylanthranilate isomerase [Wenzhouxiangella marina]|uniref:N-(5'-phosphoribosyl)anthranilate isomerase n=1 Tax=Wenzhouxiangella marina TaxID=1579979 RepID=A0A0K0XXS2_9GAMM|nr:phosphoribosylanthranilate isomerase [Wenzhouxiangella marina]AKS42411.1 N-(5''''-phosphoribosyl)anthranilate isomerase [Wenzhouxiangella marina]MBB6085815.1 phosphoribosylanthranilate isomerase [Wenzhouxiangella marina]
MIRVKVCGLTRVEDALAASHAGAHAIGLVFVERSPRCVTIEQAREIARALPPFVVRVGLFMNASAEAVQGVIDQLPLEQLQFHGNESPDFCASFQRPWIKALAPGAEPAPDYRAWAGADALLLDAHAGSTMGGSGQRFDWSTIPDLPRPWILAGGLDPDNVAEACRRTRPEAVDVSSGVETRPGIKSDRLIRAFINAVNEVSQHG